QPRESCRNVIDSETARHRRREVRIVPPPVQADLLGLVDRTDQKPDLDRQQFDVGQVDLDVTGDDESLVQDAIEDLHETLTAGRSDEVRQLGVLQRRCICCSGPSSAKASERAQVDLEILRIESEDFAELQHSLVQSKQRQAQSFDLLLRQRTTVHPTYRL